MSRLSLVVTVDPLKELDYLELLVQSLNLQTAGGFDVVFYNQRRQRWPAIVERLAVRPQFAHRVVEIEPDRFLGRYPMWDLYRLLADLVAADEVGDYLMALHMEEFLDVDYVAQVTQVLDANRFDILFGNLTRTDASPGDLRPLLACGDAPSFDRQLTQAGLKRSPHWAFRQGRLSPARLRHRLRAAWAFRIRQQVGPSRRGFWQARRYFAEDVYLMSKAFARRYNWFLAGHDMAFEDIHICERPGVCELGRHLAQLTPFPLYFDRRRIYHLRHGRYYFQIEDPEFADGILALATDDPILRSLQKAILLYRDGRLSLEQALAYSRRNPERQGSQDMNYRYHRLYLP